MRRLVIIALAGFVAQFVDGSLGMGYGVSASSLLLAAGVLPAVASFSVHAAEVVTTFVSGLSHWRFGNIDRRMVIALALPGAAGAFLGAFLLTWLSAEVARPVVSGFLFLLGLSILMRSLRRNGVEQGPPQEERPIRRKFLCVLGFVAGFLDASGGGGWGPITTSTLLARDEARPRQVVGSVDASESLVTLAATVAFVLALGWEEIHLPWVVALIAGGVVAAPLAAWLVGRIPPHLLGVLVAGAILLTNARTLLNGVGIGTTGLAAVYLALSAVWVAALALTIRNGARRYPLPEADRATD